MAREKKSEPTNDEPVQQSVHVDAPVAEAFELFTERFREWWPWAEHGEIERWTVTIWDPPHRVAFTWNSHPDETVDVVFAPESDGTRVTLTHHGWQNSGAEISCLARAFAGFASERLGVMV